MGIHPEIRKMLYSNLPEGFDTRVEIMDEREAQEYEHMQQVARNYYEAKHRFFEDGIANQLRITELELAENGEQLEIDDKMMSDKVEFMYDHLDYDYDRKTMRAKFLNEMNKKASLADIGETLDKLVANSKANMWKHYDMQEDWNKKPYKSNDKYTSKDFDWSGKLLKYMDPKTPLFIDDPSQIDMLDETQGKKIQQVYDIVKFNDARRDYSYNSLSPDEKKEISLFHSMKQDPYFKHYIYNHLRKYAEDEDEVNLNFPHSSIEKMDIYDHAKFDRLNLFDFRRNIPMKAREARIDSRMRSFGFGKRKRSKCIAQVQPGTGLINVNGRPLLQSLFLPMQRQRILLPLIVTHYTCLLDVNIRVWGGGYNGQTEAIIPALAKAVQGFDMGTRKILKYFSLMKHDGRNVERKKIGKQKARKGNVYRRR